MTRPDDKLRQLVRAEHQIRPALPPEAIRTVRSGRGSRVTAPLVLVGAALVAGTVWQVLPGSDSTPVGGAEATSQESTASPLIVHLRRDHPDVPSFAALIGDRLRLVQTTNGCLATDAGELVLWPSTATWSQEEQSVSFTQQDSSFSVTVGERFPSGIGGGSGYLDAEFMTEGGLARAERCIESDDLSGVLIVN